MINIANYDKADVLRVLYDNARPQGFGYLHFTPEPMSVEEARKMLSESDYFDYVNGRVMKVRLRGDEFNEFLYDRDNGPGAALRAIQSLEVPAKPAEENV